MIMVPSVTETHQMTTQPWYTDVVLPMLLAAGRVTYGRAIRANLEAAGFGDMPRQGSRVVGGIARNGLNLTDVSEVLGVSKQAASQLVDTLVIRGYVERIPDAEDRRRMTVGLTDRGRSAAQEIRHAVEAVDAALIERVGADDLAVARRVLGHLVELDHDPHFG
jgi:DNA-binding MarR family transcriptional regulator